MTREEPIATVLLLRSKSRERKVGDINMEELAPNHRLGAYFPFAVNLSC